MKILIPVLVGSLIGYLTNWLAIKMLFKPHYEKKFFGISIPFTPGLIPKERRRISKNIGNAVGTHLLSTDTIVDAISNTENEIQIKAWINQKIESARKEKSTVNEYLASSIGEEYRITNEKLGSKISDYIIYFIRKDCVKDSLQKFIDENIKKYNADNLYKEIEIKTKAFINKLRDSDDFRYQLEKLVYALLEKASKNESRLEETVPADIFSAIDRYLDDHKDEIGDSVKEILKDEDVKEKIKYTIANAIFDRSNKFLMAFISPDMISEKIFESLEGYIEKKESNEDIIEIIKLIVEKSKKQKVSSIAINLNKILAQISIEPISINIINSILKDKNIDKSVDNLLNLLKDNEDLNKETIKEHLWDQIQEIISSEYMESKIRYLLENTIDVLANKHISDLFKVLNDNMISNIYDLSKAVFSIFAEKELPRIIEMLNISKIVEDKINSFEIDYTEKLILDIARKELNQITRLGALLGGILGLLSPLLQYVY